MSFYIKNWKLTFLALIVFCILSSLGFWQLQRAQQKKQLLQSYESRMQASPLSAKDLRHPSAHLRFHQATLTGNFDNNRTFLLDNKTFDGQVGYEIYTPFTIKNTNTTILVDRGFVPTKRRNKLPPIKLAQNPANITGLINQAPAYYALGQMLESKEIKWPLVIEYVDLDQIAKILDNKIYPYVLQLKNDHSASLKAHWQIVIMPPEKHQAYALQWFALALTLLVLFLALNRRS